ncbi:MAG: hypothetical protein EAZ85_16280 [Bacteroidetes bacterium]|nr:MAG: hypothetical protein EAZ85_16280 [Bacteroidota bacterium]TAG85841.1 MAG: hypothetical protein EAZ20_14090 [Bacteroidota bacterium]
MNKLKYIKPENYSSSNIKHIKKNIKVVKKRDFIINPTTVGGDAPKDFIQIYEYGRVKRNNEKKWIKYIAKVGHKWYPNESITEHLLGCIGKELGLNVANSKLCIISGQIRFLSEYFLDSESQELVHGIDIFTGYIHGEDRDFIESIENENLSRDLFTFQVSKEAIKNAFPNDFESIIDDFVKLLVFDAIVGNNDRHYYNWGVVRTIKNNQKPYFSPIFDTARGLFWNDSEQKIINLIKNNNQLKNYLEKYIKNSLPKIGWEGKENLNHIRLISEIRDSNEKYCKIIDEMLSENNENKIIVMISNKFVNLFSAERLKIIIECLKLRFKLLRK